MAMLRDMQKILLGDALSKNAREKLESWLVQNNTGDDMIRAGVPKGWRVGDRPDGTRWATPTTSRLSGARTDGRRCFAFTCYSLGNPPSAGQRLLQT